MIRRSLLLGYRARLEVTGSARRALNGPGVTLLLLHNSPPATLSRLSAFLTQHRDQIVDYDDAILRCQAGSGTPSPAIAFSFDDGFLSNLDAARILADHGVSACFYVPTEVVGLDRSAVDRFFGRPQAEGVMTWDDLSNLKAAGHSIGSHCRQHKALAMMTPDAAEEQVKGSVQDLRDRLGDVRHFAWPFGNLQSAPTSSVVAWCKEVQVSAASGVRGRNRPDLLAAEGYLRRDAVDANWLGTDATVFMARSLAK